MHKLLWGIQIEYTCTQAYIVYMQLWRNKEHEKGLAIPLRKITQNTNFMMDMEFGCDLYINYDNYVINSSVL